MLWQLGAEVTLVARPGRGVLPPEMAPAEASLLTRHKQRVVLDLKRKSDVDRALALLAEADVLIEGYRPGVMERLGLGPAPCAAVNPRLVYGRMTGWGQTGPLAQAAGHDMNYVALSGLMSLAARPGALPMLPPTVLGDSAGGLGLVAGLLAGLLRARCSGQGCVVDGAIVDVMAMLAPLVQLVHAGGALDRVNPSVFYGSPFYEVYECADGRHITLGAIEPQFYAELLRRLGLDDVDPNAQMDKPAWPAARAPGRPVSIARSPALAVAAGGHRCLLRAGADVGGGGSSSASSGARPVHGRRRWNRGNRARPAVHAASGRRIDRAEGLPAPDLRFTGVRRWKRSMSSAWA